jgi:hypothetical protein
MLTFFDKIWHCHVTGTFSGDRALIVIDRRIVQETTSWHAFDTLPDYCPAARHPRLSWPGIDHTVGPSFGEISYDNSYQNGPLLIVLQESVVRGMTGAIEASADPMATIDPTRYRIILRHGDAASCVIPEERRAALLAGMDELDEPSDWRLELEEFRRLDHVARPWIWPDAG